MTTAQQPDLFGEFDQAEEDRAAAVARRDADIARYERREFIAAYATTDRKEGDRILGWVCPGCGGICWGIYTLHLNHGYVPGLPDQYPGQFAGANWGDECQRTITRAYRLEHDLPVDDDPTLDDIGVIRIEATP